MRKIARRLIYLVEFYDIDDYQHWHRLSSRTICK